jgi:hypothetical protein
MLQDSDESVSPPRLRLNVARILRGITQRPPEFIHRRIEAVLEIDESRPPDLLAQLLTADQFAWMRQQDE